LRAHISFVYFVEVIAMKYFDSYHQ